MSNSKPRPYGPPENGAGAEPDTGVLAMTAPRTRGLGYWESCYIALKARRGHVDHPPLKEAGASDD